MAMMNRYVGCCRDDKAGIINRRAVQERGNQEAGVRLDAKKRLQLETHRRFTLAASGTMYGLLRLQSTPYAYVRYKTLPAPYAYVIRTPYGVLCTVTRQGTLGLSGFVHTQRTSMVGRSGSDYLIVDQLYYRSRMAFALLSPLFSPG